jgi:NADH:ubiquinone oxidoreductase subunit F (NADH-binding)/(2Fe-2S) ferredoxin
MSNRYRKNLLVCNGSSCQQASDFDLVAFINFKLKEYNLENEIKVVHSVCSNRCSIGPNIIVYPDNVEYSKITKADIDDIIIEHLLNDRIVERLVFNTENGNGVTSKKQYRIALRNCGFIDPEEINDYIEKDGYDALAKCLTEYTPQEATQEIIKSGLRGRGGGGFPTGVKWDITSKSVADQKYVVCNADEGDPGAFMDRSVLEGDPHSVIEAMAICGYCIGATKGIIYVRAEYPLAVKRLKIALDQAREYGLLGTNIFGTDFEFTIDIKYGAGAFVCGEETALIHSMEGLRGEPTLKPPFPSVSGYLKKPTNVNNVETFANIPAIINKGGDWFASIGTEKSKGTKVFALAGKINNVGLIEVPMGTTLREVIYDIGGGIVDGKKFKAVQTGGPSGGCLTEKHLDLPIDFDSLTDAGSMMGSGGMIVMDEDDCMVSMARFYLEFIVEESCGKCAPCRIGNKRLHEMLTKLCDGKGTMQDLDLLRNLSVVVKDTSLCGLGQTSPNPIISTMTNFYDEYYAHVAEHRCPSGQCKSFMRYYISEENCIGCLVCARKCPVGAITGEKKKVHVINQELCTKCGICLEKCKFHAVYLN